MRSAGWSPPLRAGLPDHNREPLGRSDAGPGAAPEALLGLGLSFQGNEAPRMGAPPPERVEPLGLSVITLVQHTTTLMVSDDRSQATRYERLTSMVSPCEGVESVGS